MNHHPTTAEEIRGQLRDLLMALRNNRMARTQMIISLWLINRVICAQNMSETTAVRTKGYIRNRLKSNQK